MFGKDEPEKPRILKHYSAPEGQSINDKIMDIKTTMMSVRSAITYIKQKSWMAKTDVESAFRKLNVHPEHSKYMNYFLDSTAYDDPLMETSMGPELFEKVKKYGQYYQDTRLSFGLKCSMLHFQRLTMLVRLMLRRRGFTSILVYVDDFLVITESKRKCNLIWRKLNKMLNSLGLSVKKEKLEAPTRCLKFLGIWINTDTDGKGLCTFKLDQDKLKKLQHTIRVMIHNNKTKPGQITTKDLDRLLGSMATWP